MFRLLLFVFLITPALSYAGSFNSVKSVVSNDKSIVRGVARDESGISNMQSVVSSAKFDVDATLSASYDGTSQTWANFISDTSYDFYLGATSGSEASDPTFNGTAGAADAYFSTDGGDFFRLIGANPSLPNGTHKAAGTDSGPHWYAIAFRSPASWSATGGFIGNGFANSDSGFNLYHSASGEIILRYLDGDGGVNWNDATTIMLSTSTDYVIIFSGDMTTTDTVKIWVNTTTATDLTEDARDTTSNETDATDKLEIGAFGTANLPINTGVRIYAVSGGEAQLTNADAALIFAEYESRHNRDYTP